VATLAGVKQSTTVKAPAPVAIGIAAFGARTGPDLSDIGTRRLAGELERALVDAGAEAPEQSRHFRGVTKDGATITGTLLNEDKYSGADSRFEGSAWCQSQRSNLRESSIIEKGPDAFL